MKTLLLLLLLLAASAQAAIEVSPGTMQTATVGLPYEPVRIRATDANGDPLAGHQFRFHVHAPGIVGSPLRPRGPGCTEDLGSMQCWLTADTNGAITFPAMVAMRAGTHTALVEQVVPQRGDWVSLTFVAVEQRERLLVVAGNGQAVVQGGATQPFVVRVVDENGAGMSGLQVDFSDWDASPESATVTTDADGFARSPSFQAGRSLGRAFISASTRMPGNLVGLSVQIEYRVVSPTGEDQIDYQDMWWAGPAENGWGVSIAQEGQDIFPVIFTYDDRGDPTWYVAMNDRSWGGYFDFAEVSLTGYSPRSAPFHAYEASRFQLGSPVLDFRFTFHDRDSASMRGISSKAPPGPVFTKRLVRQDFTGDIPAPMIFSSGMWWGGPSQNGWGLSIMQQPGGVFMVWMTYGDDGKPTWFVMPDGQWTGANIYEGRILRASGPRWPDFDKSLLRLEDVGAFRLRFDSGVSASFEWTVGPHRGRQAIVKQPL